MTYCSDCGSAQSTHICVKTETPQRCPRCGAIKKWTVVAPKCTTADHDHWHTALVPAPLRGYSNIPAPGCTCENPIDGGDPGYVCPPCKKKWGAKAEASPEPPRCAYCKMPILGDNQTCPNNGNFSKWCVKPAAALTGTGEGPEREVAARELDDILGKFLEQVPEPGMRRIIEWWHSRAIDGRAGAIALRSQLANLVDLNNKLAKINVQVHVNCEKAECDLATAQARIAMLEEALRPFMLMAKFASGGESHVACSVRWDDLERAEQALAEPQSGEK